MLLNKPFASFLKYPKPVYNIIYYHERQGKIIFVNWVFSAQEPSAEHGFLQVSHISCLGLY